MKQRIPLFDDFDFISESELLLEAADVSDDLKKVANVNDLKEAIKGKYLMMMSKKSIGDTMDARKKGAGEWAKLYIFKLANNEDMCEIQDHSYAWAKSAETLSQMYKGINDQSTSKVFDLFMFNKKRGNKIWTVDDYISNSERSKLESLIKSFRELSYRSIYDVTGNDYGQQLVDYRKNITQNQIVVNGLKETLFYADGKWWIFSTDFNNANYKLEELKDRYAPSAYSFASRSRYQNGRDEAKYYTADGKQRKELLKRYRKAESDFEEAKKLANDWIKSQKITAA